MPAFENIINKHSFNVMVASSKLMLGIWQGIYLCEWRKSMSK